MSYVQQLKDPRWQRRRLEIFQRDGFKCTMCKAGEKELQVHHKLYLKFIPPWDYPDSWLCTMCVDCHTRITKLKDRIGWLISHPEGQQIISMMEALENAVHPPWVCPKCNDKDIKDVAVSDVSKHATCLKCSHRYDLDAPSNSPERTNI